ncbi:MAG: AlpA family phage regulatory protein [Roseomonas mucosa]|nr:AlpA family phage regulatory protein [Roseomonas mucosa]
MTTTDFAQPSNSPRRRDPRRVLGGVNTAVTPEAAIATVTPPPDWPGQVPFDPLLTAAQAARLAGVSKSTLLNFVKLGRFPRPVYLGERMPRWRFEEIRRHIAALPRAAAEIG